MTLASTSRRKSKRKPLNVLVLAPRAESADAAIDYYYDFSQNFAEFERAFASLGVDWSWQLATSRSYREVIDAFLRDAGASSPIVFNMCDGDETNDVPGIAVIHYLDSIGVPYTGANAAFYQATTSKIDMKRAFDAAGVSTSPWQAIGPTLRGTASLFKRLGTPLILKPAVSAGSMGITVKSVVDTPEALREQVKELYAGYHGWDLAGGGLFVERYIAGPEFTTFIVGSAVDPDRAVIYPPVERVFHAALPPNEKFLSFDRLWEVHEREQPLADGKSLWEYEPAPATLRERIESVSWAAYAAVNGHGYGRVDLRMDAETGDLHVLEVNAQCGLSEDENYTSIGAILRYANRSFAEMVQQVVENAVMAHPQAGRRARTARLS